MRGPQEYAVAGLAQSEHGEPAVDPSGLDPGVNLGRDKRQPEADQEALQNVSRYLSRTGKEMPKDEGIDEEIDAYRADEDRKVRVEFAHGFILSLLS